MFEWETDPAGFDVGKNRAGVGQDERKSLFQAAASHVDVGGEIKCKGKQGTCRMSKIELVALKGVAPPKAKTLASCWGFA